MRETLYRRVETTNIYTFEQLTAGTWKCFPALGPKSHFYPPSVVLVEPQNPSVPLIYNDVNQKLEKEYNNLVELLNKRKKSSTQIRPGTVQMN